MGRKKLLEVKNLSQHFKLDRKTTVKAVDDISFKVKQGELNMAKILNKLQNQIGVEGPVLTIVMDGVGLAPATEASFINFSISAPLYATSATLIFGVTAAVLTNP